MIFHFRNIIASLLPLLSIGYFNAIAQKQFIFSDKDYSFKLKLDSVTENNWGRPDRTIKLITVTRLIDHKIIQTIVPGKNYVNENFKNELIIEDINVDGHNDFKLFGYQAKRESGYLFWLFDPVKEKFFHDAQWDEKLTDAYVDSKNKCLRSMTKVSAGNYVSVIYRFIGNKLILLEEEDDENTNADSVLITYRKRTNGKMKLIKKIQVSQKDYEKVGKFLMPLN